MMAREDAVEEVVLGDEIQQTPRRLGQWQAAARFPIERSRHHHRFALPEQGTRQRTHPEVYSREQLTPWQGVEITTLSQS